MCPTHPTNPTAPPLSSCSHCVGVHYAICCQASSGVSLPLSCAPCDLLPSVWCRSLNHASPSSIMWLQCAATESPEVFFWGGAHRPPLMLLTGPLCRSPRTQLHAPFKKGNQHHTYPTVHQSLSSFSERTGVSHNYLCAANQQAHSHKGRSDAHKPNTYTHTSTRTS